MEFLDNQRLPDVRLETSYRGSGLGGTQFLRTGGFPGAVTGTRSRGFGDALGQVFTPRLPDLERRRRRELSARPQLRGGQPRARRGRAPAGGAADREPRVRDAETVRQAARQMHSTAERVDAARAGETLAEQRLAVEQRRFEAGLSTTFLVTQAQRDLLQAQVNLLQTPLDYQSALVNFEAVQHRARLSSTRRRRRFRRIEREPADAGRAAGHLPRRRRTVRALAKTVCDG